VGAGRRDDQRAHSVVLAEHLGKIGGDCDGPFGSPRGYGGKRIGGATLEHAYGTGQPLGDGDVDALDEGGLASALRAQDERLEAGTGCALGGGEGTLTGAYLTVEAELPEQRDAIEEVGSKLAAGGEHRTRQREVERGADLGQVTRREIGNDPLAREFIARVDDRGTNPIASLAYTGVAETDDPEGGKPWTNVDLDRDWAHVEAIDCKRMCARKQCDHPWLSCWVLIDWMYPR
jgi:hypothetical protein